MTKFEQRAKAYLQQRAWRQQVKENNERVRMHKYPVWREAFPGR